MNTSPYEIIIIISVGTMVIGCLMIWECERICHRYIVARKHREPLLNLLESGDGFSKISSSESSSFSSGSESETTSCFMTSIC